MIGTMEIIVILLAALILFGGKRLPEIARNIGKAVNALRKEFNEFKKAMEEEDRQDKDSQGWRFG